MKRWLLCLALGLMAFGINQKAVAQAQYAFRVAFVNKAGTASFSDAGSFLSARALSRRAAQGIALDSLDLPVSPAYLDSTLTLTGGLRHVTSRWFNQCVILLTDTSQIPLLRNKSYVRSVALVGYFSTPLHLKSSGSNGSLSQNNTALKGAGTPAYYGQSYTQTALVNGDALHDAGYTGNGKLIAVLDMGFLELNTHQGFDSLHHSGRLVETHNFLTANSTVDVSSIHGTASLSAMAGYEPGVYVGSAPHASYALYLTEDAYTEQPVETDMMVAGLERADSLGVDISSISLGYNIFTGPVMAAYTHDSLSGDATLPARAVNLATKRGMLCVVAAGNEGGNSWDYLLTPGDADSALTVGAVDAGKVVAAFSSPGPNASGRVKPDICMMGNPATVFLNGNTIGASSGTSFATPQAAGFAACLWQAVPTATPYDLRQAIVASADHYTAPETKLGYGVPDFGLAMQQLHVSPAPMPALDINVGPVPFRHLLKLTLPSVTGSYHLSLFGMNGALLWQSRMAAGTWEVNMPADLASGIYFLKVTGEKGTVVRKLVKD